MVETHPERRDRGDDFSLSGKRGHRNPRRHSGREAGIPGRESYRGSHAAVSLVIPAGKPESSAMEGSATVTRGTKAGYATAGGGGARSTGRRPEGAAARH